MGLLASSAVTGCGVADTFTDRVRDAQAEEPSVVTIGVMVPQSGAYRIAGQGVLESVRAAVHDATPVPGWVVKVSAVDSFADDLEGAALTAHLLEAAETLEDDDSVVAVVGGMSSEAVLATAPMLSDEAVPLLSPSDDDPRHYRGADPQQPSRPWRAYGVTTVLSDPQVVALAEYMTVDLGLHRVAVVHDGSPRSTDRLDDLERALAVRDGKVVSRGMVTSPDSTGARASRKSAKAAAEAVRRDNSEAVVVLGDETLVSLLRSALGTDLPLGVPADSLAAPLADLPEELEGVLVAKGGPDPDAGRDELSAKLAESAGGAPGPYGTAAYDAARLVLEGLNRCLPAAEVGQVAAPLSSPPRESCADDIVFASASGISREVVLDEYGARVGMLAAMGAVSSGKWRALAE